MLAVAEAMLRDEAVDLTKIKRSFVRAGERKVVEHDASVLVRAMEMSPKTKAAAAGFDLTDLEGREGAFAAAVAAGDWDCAYEIAMAPLPPTWSGWHRRYWEMQRDIVCFATGRDLEIGDE